MIGVQKPQRQAATPADPSCLAHFGLANSALTICHKNPIVKADCPFSYTCALSPTSAISHTMSASGAGKCFPERIYAATRSFPFVTPPRSR